MFQITSCCKVKLCVFVSLIVVVVVCLCQCQHDLVSEAVFEQKKKTVNQVIRRMVKHDGVIMVVGSSPGSNSSSTTAATTIDARLADVGSGDGVSVVVGKQQKKQRENEDKLLKLHPSYDP